MNDQELKKMKRNELLSILLAQSEEIDSLKETIADQQKRLDDRRIMIEESGSVAEAALRLNGFFDAAEKSAAQYLENIQTQSDEIQAKCDAMMTRTEAECGSIRSQAETECTQMRADTQAECDQMRSDAKIECDRMRKDAQAECAKMRQDVKEECDDMRTRTMTEYNDFRNRLEKGYEEIRNRSKANSSTSDTRKE